MNGQQHFHLLLLLCFFFFFTACQTSSEPAPKASPRPNIILIMTDDQGYGDLGFHGNPAIKTPHLDELARNSTRFREFYVSPVCAPTRASLLTGRFTLRTGVFDTYNGGAIMATEEQTIAEILRDNGYRTAIFGKWHLGDNYPSRPQDQGFDESLVHLAGGIGQVGDYLNYHRFDSSYFDPKLLRNGQVVETMGYCSDVYTDAAIDFISEQADSTDPFFLYLSFNAPHTPLQVPQEYYNLYADLDSVPGASAFPEVDFEERHVEEVRRLYGMVTNIDDNVGRLIAQLEELGIRENTLLVFLTDNGPQQRRYTAGLRARKGAVYEGGIRVPCFWNWPGKLAVNREIPTHAAHVDLLPSLLGICGIPSPQRIEFDGENLSGILLEKDTITKKRALVFEWQRGFPEPYRNIAVRKGPYKLAGQTDYQAVTADLELYHIPDDPYEQRNLVSEQPNKAKELQAIFDKYLEAATGIWPAVHPRIYIGSEQENPVVLNRNDAKGSGGIWRQDQIYAYWDVWVENAGVYDCRVHFFEPLGQAGELVLQIGPVQRTLRNETPSATMIEMKNIPLQKGEQMAASWYRGDEGGGPLYFTHFPFYVELDRK